MNHKLSDIDKVIISAWLFFGAGLGVFVSPLFKANPLLTGAIGLLTGALIAYIFFFEPFRRRQNNFSYSNDYTEEEGENEDSIELEEETDISKFIKDSIKAEGLDLESGTMLNIDKVNTISSEDESNLQANETESDQETNSNLVIEETEEITDEDAETNELSEDEEAGYEQEDDENISNNEEQEEPEEQDSIPAFYGNKYEIHSSYDNEYVDNPPKGIKAWLTPVQLPITLSALWFFASGLILKNNPEIEKLITKHFPASFFVILPIFFLIGLSGLIGIMSREQNETLEISPKENIAYLINLLKILIGWGIGIYAILVNLPS